MADLEKITQLLADGEKMGEVKKAVGKLQTVINDLVAVLGGGKAPTSKLKTPKLDHPKPDTKPLALCKVMGAKPMTAAEIAKKVGKSEATVKLYLYKFSCFSCIRGQGYIYTPLPTTTTKKKTTKKKSKKKT